MTFKIATYNANSIRSRIALVQDWISRERPDVLCIQETKVQDQDFPQEAFTEVGYHIVYRGQKAYSGVAVASLEEPEAVSFGLDSEPKDEARLIAARVRGITIVNTYVPQGRSVDSEMFAYKLQWLARLRDYFEHAFSPDEALIWCGDLNVAPQEIDVHDSKRLAKHVDFHPQAREALAKVTEWGLEDVFRRHHPDEPGQYTFWDYRVRGHSIGTSAGALTMSTPRNLLRRNQSMPGSTVRHVRQRSRPIIRSLSPNSRFDSRCTLLIGAPAHHRKIEIE